MKYVIWGAGFRGGHIFKNIGTQNVAAFIDSDPTKVGSQYCGKEIISYEDYKSRYRECYIVISCLHEKEIIEKLMQDNYHKYFLLSECPGEFQESNQRDLLEEYIVNTWSDPKQNVIYGVTLYTFIMNQWIKKSKGSYLRVVVPEHGDAIAQWKHDYPEMDFCTLSEVNFDKIKNILMVNERDLEGIFKFPKDISVINVYDCSDKIEAYYNPQIEKFRKIHEGKRCFIVATGPSLKYQDLEKLKKSGEICFSMNAIWKAFPHTDWRPDYYIADDWRCMSRNADILDNMKVGYLFLGDTCKEYWEKKHKKNILCHHFVYEYSEDRLPKFSEDFSRQCYMGSTVTYSCLQLAVYMGFKEIYLLGVDFSYSGESGDAKYAHFFKEKKLESIGYEKQVTLAYLAAKQYEDKHDIKIYNATRGGKLEIFERVDFERLFD